MLFHIRHDTCYRYSAAVQLGPQLLRFTPRQDGTQAIVSHEITVSPQPTGRNDFLDLEGNLVTQVWFNDETTHLDIHVGMQVDTRQSHALDFILEPHATRLPIDHSQDSLCARAYLQRIDNDDSVTAFAAQFSQQAGSDTLTFLNHLNTRLYEDFRHIHRDTGVPQSPAHTLSCRHGACRDLAVLFVECCRAEGIPARFASGYQRGNLEQEKRHLHAWPEVYLPGAGWRGYDPTHGEEAADTHVTIAAASDSRNTMPVTGSFSGNGIKSTLNYNVSIQVDNES